MGERKRVSCPYVGTTYRLTEHFHTWTKHALLNAIAQPENHVEISENLAASKGIANGDAVKVVLGAANVGCPGGCRGDPTSANAERQWSAG